MEGLSGTYAFNGTSFTLQPTTGKWVERTQYGIDGGAHPVYATPRSFEITWQLINVDELQQIINFYNLVSNTGTVVTCLPQWGAADYRFKNYSGTTLQEPMVGEYFQGYIQSVTLLVLNVRT